MSARKEPSAAAVSIAKKHGIDPKKLRTGRIKPRSEWPETSAARRVWLRRRPCLVTLLVAVLTALMGAPAQAEERKVLAYASADCTDGPSTNADVVARISAGKMYTFIAEHDITTDTWIRVGGRKCLAAPVTLIKGNLDPATFKKTFLRPDEETAGNLAVEVADRLFGAKPMIRSLPSPDAPKLGEVAEGDVVDGAAWTTEGKSTIAGVSGWRPVKAAGGTVGWVQQEALVEVPSYKPGELASTVTPERAVELHEQPSTSSAPVTTVEAGGKVSCATTPWGGWLACKSPEGGEKPVWLRQADLTEPESEGSEFPSPDQMVSVGGLSYDVQGYAEPSRDAEETVLARAGVVELMCAPPRADWIACSFEGKPAWFEADWLSQSGARLSSLDEAHEGEVVETLPNGDRVVVCETTDDKARAAADPEVRCEGSQEVIDGAKEKAGQATDKVRETAASIKEKAAKKAALMRLKVAGAIGGLAVLLLLLAHTVGGRLRLSTLLTGGPRLLLAPAGFGAAGFAAMWAPNDHYQLYVLPGAAVLALITLVVAARWIGKPTTDTVQWALVGALAGTGIAWLMGLSLPTAMVAGGVLAGIGWGLLAGLLLDGSKKELTESAPESPEGAQEAPVAASASQAAPSSPEASTASDDAFWGER